MIITINKGKDDEFNIKPIAKYDSHGRLFLFSQIKSNFSEEIYSLVYYRSKSQGLQHND